MSSYHFNLTEFENKNETFYISIKEIITYNINRILFISVEMFINAFHIILNSKKCNKKLKRLLFIRHFRNFRMKNNENTPVPFTQI